MVRESQGKKDTNEQDEIKPENTGERSWEKQAQDAGTETRMYEDSPETSDKHENDNDEIEQLKNELSDAKAEAAETYDRLLRLSAEFENYKKRTQRQMEENRKYANEELIKDLLSVVDNLERALTAAGEKKTETDTNMAEGIEMTLNEILKTLEKHNVSPIKAKGTQFDPTYHEALMQEENDEYPENTVIKEMQKGYLLNDRLIRPAMVVVSKAKSS